MPKRHGDFPRLPVFVFEPRFVTVRLAARWPRYAVDTAAVLIAKPQAGQDIGD